MVNVGGVGSNGGEVLKAAVQGLRDVNQTMNEVFDAANQFIEEQQLALQREQLANIREQLARLAAQLEKLGQGGGTQRLAAALSRIEGGLDSFAISGGANQQDGQQMNAIRQIIEELRSSLGGINPS